MTLEERVAALEATTGCDEKRLQAIETKLNQMQTAINTLASRQMVKALANVREQEIKDINEEIDSLKTQVSALQG